jgi:phosphatidylserine synthase
LAQDARRKRSEAKDEAARAALAPLGAGERPLPVTIGAAVALVLGLVEVPLYFAWSGDKRPSLAGFVFFTGLMLVMAWGMWRVKYWAVLGFQALLALCILVFSLLALRFQTALDLVIAIAVIVPACVLFWFMVKALARIQMPERR